MARDKPRTTSLHPRESFVCIFLFLVELAAVSFQFKTIIKKDEEINAIVLVLY